MHQLPPRSSDLLEQAQPGSSFMCDIPSNHFGLLGTTLQICILDALVYSPVPSNKFQTPTVAPLPMCVCWRLMWLQA